MENWKLLLAGIRNALKETFNIRGSVEVSNLPDVQRVEITNPQEPTETVVVSNLIDYKEELNKIIGELIKVPKDIKTADYTPIIDALKEVVRTLEDDKTDYSPVILSIESAVKELKTKFPEVDYSEIINTIKGIQQFNLGDYLYEGELPVIINDKQIKKLVDAFGKKTSQVIAASGGGFSEIKVKNASNVVINPATEEKQDAIITALGEVQASPTANTVLDRLKAIKTSVDSATPAGTNLIGKVGIDQTTDGTTNKVAATQSTHDNLNGNANIQVANTDVSTSNPVPVKSMPPDTDVTTNTNAVRKYYTSTGAATDGIVWSPAAGKRWHITSLYFQVSADATVTFEDDKAAGDDPVLKGEFKAGSGLSLTFDKNYPMASGEDAADLLVTTSAGNIYITIVGFEV